MPDQLGECDDLFLFTYLLFHCLPACMGEGRWVASHRAHVEVREKLKKASSLLLQCEFQGLNSGHPAWQQAPLSTKPGHQPQQS